MTERALPGCWPLWICSRVAAQRQATHLTQWPPNLEAHIGSPGWWQLWSVGVEFHWQTKENRRACCSLSLQCAKKNPLGLEGCETTKWLPHSLEYWLYSLFSGQSRPQERNFGFFRLHTLLNVPFCTYYMYQKQISQAFFLWDEITH